MIRARHDAWAEALFHAYLRRLLARSFHALRLIGEAPVLPEATPVLLTGNHSTWWDGFFVYLLNRRIFHRTLYLMMLEEQLRRYPFFRRLGAYGIRQGHPRSVMDSLYYTAALLEDPGNLVCLFPQGALTPYRRRPLSYRPGLERIVKMHGGPATLLPVAMRCEHLGERRPEAFFLLGRPREVTAASCPSAQALAAEQERLMDSLDRAINGGEQGRVLLGAGAGTGSRGGGAS